VQVKTQSSTCDSSKVPQKRGKVLHFCDNTWDLGPSFGPLLRLAFRIFQMCPILRSLNLYFSR